MDSFNIPPATVSTRAIKAREFPVYIVTPMESRQSAEVIAMQVRASVRTIANISSLQQYEHGL